VLPEHELAEIIRRAAAIGVPAWRVRTALAAPLPPEPSAVWGLPAR
jgi:hypothetical protein